MAKIPDKQTIEKLFLDYHTPSHVVEHCKKVALVAVFLAHRMKERSYAVNIELVNVAALLHDFVRVVDFRTFDPKKMRERMSEEDIVFCQKLREEFHGTHHAVAGAQILEKLGYPEIARVVLKHRFLQIEEGFETLEEKIVYYADKRVKHAEIVPLADRIEDGRKRNAPETEGTPSTKKLDEKVFALEKEICDTANIKPNVILSLSKDEF